MKIFCANAMIQIRKDDFESLPEEDQKVILALKEGQKKDSTIVLSEAYYVGVPGRQELLTKEHVPQALVDRLAKGMREPFPFIVADGNDIWDRDRHYHLAIAEKALMSDEDIKRLPSLKSFRPLK